MNIKEYFHTTVNDGPKSLCLDGVNDRVSIPDRYEFDTELSVFAWVKAEAQTPGVIASQWESSNSLNRRLWLMQVKNGKLNVILSSDGGNTNILDVETVDDVFDDTWAHVGFTFNAGTLSLYANGVAQAVNINVNQPVAALFTPVETVPLLLGAKDPCMKTSFLDAHLYEVSIYDKELSPSEYTTIYAGGYPTNLLEYPSSSNLISWWKLGDIDAFPVVPDLMGFSNGKAEGMLVTNIIGDAP